MQRSTKSGTYRVLSMSWNPVKNNNSDKAAKMFKNVAEAYDVLSTPQYRGIYDLRGAKGLSEENYSLSRTPQKIFSKFLAQITLSHKWRLVAHLLTRKRKNKVM